MAHKTVTKEIASDFRNISPERSVVLPKSAMAIPIIFWALLLLILISALLIGRKGNTLTREALRMDTTVTKLEMEIVVVEKRKDALRKQIFEADRLYSWVTQVPMIQPFIIKFFESFDEDDRVSRIVLKYSKDTPGQFEFQSVYQGDALDITTLFQRNMTELSKVGWTLAQSERKIKGQTVIIDSYIRVDANSPWVLFGVNEEEFLSSADPQNEEEVMQEELIDVSDETSPQT